VVGRQKTEKEARDELEYQRSLEVSIVS
jgi:hypothetical protein